MNVKYAVMKTIREKTVKDIKHGKKLTGSNGRYQP